MIRLQCVADVLVQYYEEAFNVSLMFSISTPVSVESPNFTGDLRVCAGVTCYALGIQLNIDPRKASSFLHLIGIGIMNLFLNLMRHTN